MAASQEICQHDAGSPGLGELVRFSAEPQLAELQCLDGGAALRQGINVRAAAAAAVGTSGSAVAASRTGAQVDSQDYQLIQHVKEPSVDVIAGHAEGDLFAMPQLQTGDGSLIGDVQPLTKLDTVLVEDTPQVSAATRRPMAALFARVVCPSAPDRFDFAGYRRFSFCLVLLDDATTAAAAAAPLPLLPRCCCGRRCCGRRLTHVSIETVLTRAAFVCVCLHSRLQRHAPRPSHGAAAAPSSSSR
jgi:hypothetical protein